MVDNVFTESPASNDTAWATDDVSGVHHLRVKVQHGTDGSAADVSTASPMPVDLRTDNLGLALEAGGNLADIETNTDFGAVTGGGVESGALRVTVASDSTGVLTVDHPALDLAHSEDFDSGAGTDNTMAVVEITDPVVDGDDIVYAYKLLDGTIPENGGTTALFIDRIGIGGGVGVGYHGVGVGARGPGVTGWRGVARRSCADGVC